MMYCGVHHSDAVAITFRRDPISDELRQVTANAWS